MATDSKNPVGVRIPDSAAQAERPTNARLKELRERHHRAAEILKQRLKPGDQVRVTKCPGTKRTITFSHWDGSWMVSASGICDYSPGNVDCINGQAVKL